jgi:iron-sulfur cluster assembly accessory protein
MNKRIHRNMTIANIFSSYPHHASLLADEMANMGLHCAGCGGAEHETLDQGMRAHGMTDKHIDTLISQLNQIIDQPQPETVSLTPNAAQQFRAILERENKPLCAIRLGIESAGCCHTNYFLDYSLQPCDGDVILESSGIQIHVQKEHLIQLSGTVIDYSERPDGDGFQILRKQRPCSHSGNGCCCS